MGPAADVFVWTKMGDDAGEVIRGILARKEAERSAGTFWWGIGSSLERARLRQALTECGSDTLPVLFSSQLSRPRRGRSGGMRLWTRWFDETGTEQDIPGHALVIGPGDLPRYYALVCRSDDSIACLHDQPFDDQLFHNYPHGARPGASQNTALLTGCLRVDQRAGRYRRGFRATLVWPWLVTLAGSRVLSPDEQKLIADWNGDDYLGLVCRIRGAGSAEPVAAADRPRD